MSKPDAEAQNDSTLLLVNEIYRSIQGESTWAGLPCTFVRLTGCNLRCVWCDTEFAFHEGKRMTVAEVLSEVDRLGCDLVEVTGGEPLLQATCLDLMTALADTGRQVLLETSGSLDISPVDPRVVKIVDAKCPSSGEESRNLWTNLEHLRARDELKFVIGDRVDYEWSRELIERHHLEKQCILLMGVVHDTLEPRTLVEWILEDHLQVRFQTQLHKQIWPADERGV